MTLIQRIKKGGEQGGGGNQPPRRSGESDVKSRHWELAALKSRIQTELFAKLDLSFSENPPPDARTKIEALFNAIVDAIPAEENVVLSSLEKDQLLEAIAPVIVGFGPLAALMADNSVVEIMVNNPKE